MLQSGLDSGLASLYLFYSNPPLHQKEGNPQCNPKPFPRNDPSPGLRIQRSNPLLHCLVGAGQPTLVQGLGWVTRRMEMYWLLSIEGRGMELGIWWMEAAMRGAVGVLPIVNQEPRFEERAKEEKGSGVRC